MCIRDSHISEGTFFPFSQIKFRTVELGFSCSLKNTIPIGPLCQTHWHKIVLCQLIVKKLHGFCWKIHVDLKSGNGLTVNKLLGFFLKCFCIPGIQKHLERGIDWLVKQCFIESKLCDLPVSYTHLDVYKRQAQAGAVAAENMYAAIKDVIANAEGQVIIGEVNQDATAQNIQLRGAGFINKMIELIQADGKTVAVAGNEFYRCV